MSKLLLETATLEEEEVTEPAEVTELLLDLASEEEVGFTEELDSFAFSSDELEFLEPLEDEDWRSPLEAGMTEEEEYFDFSTEEEEDGKVTEPAEVTDDEPAEAPAEVTVEEEISATGSEDAVLALVLSSQAVRKQSVKAKKMDPIALEFILDLFLSAPG
jgi:hypothetical protein